MGTRLARWLAKFKLTPENLPRFILSLIGFSLISNGAMPWEVDPFDHCPPSDR